MKSGGSDRRFKDFAQEMCLLEASTMSQDGGLIQKADQVSECIHHNQDTESSPLGSV